MSKETWTWTDELVKEFCKGVIDVQFAHPHDVNIMNGMCHFKKEKQQSENKDYEVISSTCENGEVRIRSVKRLSDNEIFSVGDYAHYCFYDKGFTIKIAKFQIINNQMYLVNENNNQSINISDAKKQSKPVLFTTEQREEIISIIKTFIK